MSFHHHHSAPPGEYKALAFRRLAWSFGITASVMVVEAVGGWLSGSLALISDAGHMLTHAFAIAVGMFGILIARRPACHHRTFGLLRAEVLAALFNSMFLLVVTVWIVVESIARLREPREILTMQMLAVAVLGLLVNLVSIFLLESSRRGDLNVHSVFLHMIGDAASSVGIVVTALVIRFTGWNWLDPIVSLGIAVLIAIWAWSLLRESVRVLLEMAPRGFNVHEITEAMRAQFPHIVETSNEHLWTITPEVIVFSAHLTVDADGLSRSQLNAWLHRVEHWAAEHYGIAELTLQVCFLDGSHRANAPAEEVAHE